jgi:hypothetical protein
MALTKKITGAIAAIAFVLTAVLTFAFKADIKNETNKRLTTTWYYNSNSMDADDIINGNNWTTVNPEHTGCSSANEALPCQLEVDEAVTTPTELDTYFIDEFGDSATAIKTAATSRRPIP